tara:strand:- start:1815 stop:2093 length:279 start_codon:yes stop_codon:yes gene_type:complete
MGNSTAFGSPHFITKRDEKVPPNNLTIPGKKPVGPPADESAKDPAEPKRNENQDGFYRPEKEVNEVMEDSRHEFRTMVRTSLTWKAESCDFL